jgi:hypothetical protein
MRIAIVGGGFFGCYITRAINKRFGNNVEVSIFDRDNQLMSRAATNNQCRLHLGFHYPRSIETIEQTVEGFVDFKEEFNNSIYFPSENYYAVHKDGLVNFEQYLAVMDKFNLSYEVCDKNKIEYFKDPDKIDGVIKVGEGVIKLNLLLDNLLRSLSAKVYNQSIVTAINSETGYLIANDKKVGPFDFIINTTYVDPNLGLPKELQYKVKYELTGMVLLKAPMNNIAITIMDGDFVSLYPIGGGMATLSSVVHTPFAKCDTVQELERLISNSNKVALDRNVIENIMNHGKELIDLELLNTEIRGLWIAPKTKIHNDVGNTRISAIRNSKRLISILCGKLDSVHKIADNVIAILADEEEVDKVITSISKEA